MEETEKRREGRWNKGEKRNKVEGKKETVTVTIKAIIGVIYRLYGRALLRSTGVKSKQEVGDA